MSEICIIVTIVVYLAAMLLVGFAYSKTNNDSADFYLGGRKMGPLVTAMSAEASDMSSWLLMGMPGLAYLTGIASPGWTAIGLALGTWLNWLIVARRLRRYSANLDAITVPQFLSLRFHDQRNLLNALGAVIIIVFFVPYTASGFAACGKLFHSLFGVDYMAAMLVSALVIVGYTILGGGPSPPPTSSSRWSCRWPSSRCWATASLWQAAGVLWWRTPRAFPAT